MTTEPERNPNEPELILSPGDLDRRIISALNSINFSNPTYYEIAELLEKMSKLERKAEKKLRALEHDSESYEDLKGEIENDIYEARKRMHKLFLRDYEYDSNKPSLTIVPSDAYKNREVEDLPFRNSDLKYLAHHIAMMARFEQELESYLTEWDELPDRERNGMMRDTMKKLESYKELVTERLLGKYDE